MLNIYGYDLLTRGQLTYPELGILFGENYQTDHFCSTENTKFIPITFEFFVKEFVHPYIGYEKTNDHFILEFVLHFNEWLFQNRLTQIQLDISLD
jgi:hypothetical protein